jgi:hypothetical protein
MWHENKVGFEGRKNIRVLVDQRTGALGFDRYTYRVLLYDSFNAYWAGFRIVDKYGIAVRVVFCLEENGCLIIDMSQAVHSWCSFNVKIS